jgi:hypothetical protein
MWILSRTLYKLMELTVLRCVKYYSTNFYFLCSKLIDSTYLTLKYVYMHNNLDKVVYIWNQVL